MSGSESRTNIISEIGLPVTWYVVAKYDSLDCFKLEHNILLLPEKGGSNICNYLVPNLIVT
jgi:hypothetical protein